MQKYQVITELTQKLHKKNHTSGPSGIKEWYVRRISHIITVTTAH